MARKRGRQFRGLEDASDQFESIEKLQRKIRQGKIHGKIADSIEKTRQRERNAQREIRKSSDARPDE